MEGGAKGVILLSLAHQDRAPVAFRKYVDCLLDVVMPQVSQAQEHYSTVPAATTCPTSTASFRCRFAAPGPVEHVLWHVAPGCD